MNVAFKEPAKPTRSLDAIAEALLLPTGIDGVYARTALFEDVVGGLTALISRHREPRTEVLRFPPVMSRRQLEKSGYLKSFPHLLGCVCCLGGAETEIRAARRPLRGRRRLDAGAGGGRSRAHPRRLLSGLSAGREPRQLPADGLIFDVACDCFRREPSQISTACSRSACGNMSASARRKQIDDSADAWMTQAQGLADQLGLPWRIEPRVIRSSAAAAS